MSLLIKALKQAEQKHPSGNGNGNGKASTPGSDFSLEPLEETPNHDANGMHAAGNYFAASAPGGAGVLRLWLDPRNWSLVPATLVFALLFSIGYGYYVYLMTRPPVPLAASISALPPLPPAAAPQETATPAPDTARRAAPKNDQPAPESGSVPSASLPAKPAAAPAEKELAVAVASTPAAPRTDPLAVSAYNALQAGRMDEAQALYQRFAAAEPRSTDALLGLAAIAVQQGRPDQASKYYMQVLEIAPDNAPAQAGLIGLIGSADPLESESRLKQLIAAQPSAFLHFTLGNLYAGQGKWPAAEQAYFQAQQLAPANADYAFNLAVSLEHLNQPAIALTYYRRAQQFARGGTAHFDAAGLAARIAKLSSPAPEETHY